MRAPCVVQEGRHKPWTVTILPFTARHGDQKRLLVVTGSLLVGKPLHSLPRGSDRRNATAAAYNFTRLHPRPRFIAAHSTTTVPTLHFQFAPPQNIRYHRPIAYPWPTSTYMCNTEMATKVTSVCSTSGVPTPPNATPRTEASVGVEVPPFTDLNAVGTILGTVQEDLNESADAAMYPSPPINTPEPFSPSPSVYKAVITRGRGLSAIGDRLAQLKLEDRVSPRKDTDVTSSNRSVVASIEENEDEADGEHYFQALNGMMRSPCPVQAPAIPIALGSPSNNPRIEEYLNFTSDDLPVTGPDKQGPASTHLPTGHLGLHSRDNSIMSGKSDGAASGVTEKSTWAEEVEDGANRAVMRLEQLATDEYKVDPSKTMEDYYIARLQKLLNASGREVKVTVSKTAKGGQ